MNFREAWKEKCEAARMIENEFGTQNALQYLIGEKFLDFLADAEQNAEVRAELPALVAEIKTIFEPWQLAEYLETARHREPFDPRLYDEDDDPDEMEMARQEDIRDAARDLLLVERAKEWLLDGNE